MTESSGVNSLDPAENSSTTQASFGQMCTWIVAQCVDGVVCADRDGVIRIWNGGAEQFLGYKADEAIGQSLDLILPEACRPRHWKAFNRWFERGEDRVDEPFGVIPLIHQNGVVVQMESTFVRVRDDAGQPVAAGSIIRPAGLSAH